MAAVTSGIEQSMIRAENKYAPTPLQLTQYQVDDLVEASVPDHVLYYVELNQPQLINDIAPANRYGLV